jgi:hypothetical protein
MPFWPAHLAKLVQNLLHFVFFTENADVIKLYIQPFILADGSSKHQQANLELACTYGVSNSGE